MKAKATKGSDQKANTEAKPLPPEGRLKTPPAQDGDKPDEMAKPVAQPKLQSLDEGKAELDKNPARTSTLTDAGHLVRE